MSSTAPSIVPAPLTPPQRLASKLWGMRQGPLSLKHSLRLRLFTWSQLPLLGLARPFIAALGDASVTVGIPMGRRTRNFRGAMAFGPIIMGAECAAGFLFGEALMREKLAVGFVVAGCEAQFLHPFRSTALFHVALEAAPGALLRAVLDSGEKTTVPVTVEGRDQEGQLCATFRFDVVLHPTRRR